MPLKTFQWTISAEEVPVDDLKDVDDFKDFPSDNLKAFIPATVAQTVCS